jgi:hypothetical protein
MNRDPWRTIAGKATALLLFGWVLFQACAEFYQIAWDTGEWRGEFSFTWALLFYSFIFLCSALFMVAALFIWRREWLSPLIGRMIASRARLGGLRWLLSFLILVAPIWFFQYTPWGVVFQKFYFRMLIWMVAVYLLAVIFSRGNHLFGWNEFLYSLVLTSSLFSIAASLRFVNDYPFSLGWSEGNRLWDYSILFGSERYDYPFGRKIPVFLDFGRQFISGLPFLFPGVSIGLERLWVGLTLIFPYILLGLAAFRKESKDRNLWLVATLWAFLFLKQGPIHPPLVLSAALVAFAWRSSLLYAMALMLGAGYLAEASRFSWAFAPAMWIIMLEFASASFSDHKIAAPIWKRSIILGLSGLFGSFFLAGMITNLSMPFAQASGPAVVTAMPTAVVTATPQIPATPVPTGVLENLPHPTYIDYVIRLVKDQPFLWYRLLPNSTYGNGILFALLLAVGPLLMILFYLSAKKLWRLNSLQKLCLVLPSLIFLVVGLVASTKIGGGGDLHNMDMFLIGLFFTGVIAWQNGGREWLQNAQAVPQMMKVMVVLLIALSSVSPLLEMRSYSFGEDLHWLRTLTDSPVKATLDMLPVSEVVDSELQTIQREVDRAVLQGDVLFMDQRQLLTFGYIKGVPLVAQYEKKFVMNQALSTDAEYFREFYSDLAAHRFSLIVTEPLRTPIKDSSYQFGEENNAWVKWVASPILCYYEPLDTLKEVNVQLLVPKSGTVNCPPVLP